MVIFFKKVLMCLFVTLTAVQTYATTSKSDLFKIFPYISTVKNQQGRNTCTVFSLTALIESLYVREGGDPDIDFSEEWLQYMAALTNASGGAKGSTVATNFKNVKKYGLPLESTMPFTAKEWTTDPSDRNAKEINNMCGSLSGLKLTRCLFGKRHPSYIHLDNDQLFTLPNGKEFVEAREDARILRQNFTRHLQMRQVRNPSQVKSLLLQNIPLTLEINVYYGSWNYPNKFGVDYKTKHFKKGEVNYPEKGSVDRRDSPKHRARHSVLIIGYDDDIELTYEKLMTDGSTQKFTRKGVYYIKNSWGRNFGLKFKYKGKRIPGLGVITQDFANEMGKFTSVSLK